MKTMTSSSSKSNTEFIEKINKAYNEAWDLINTRSGWQPAKAMFLRSTNLDKIEWRRRRTGGSSNRKSSGIVYRVTATLPSPKEKVVALLRDVNNIASWNRTLQVSCQIHAYAFRSVATFNPSFRLSGLSNTWTRIQSLPIISPPLLPTESCFQGTLYWASSLVCLLP